MVVPVRCHITTGLPLVERHMVVLFIVSQSSHRGCCRFTIRRCFSCKFNLFFILNKFYTMKSIFRFILFGPDIGGCWDNIEIFLSQDMGRAAGQSGSGTKYVGQSQDILFVRLSFLVRKIPCHLFCEDTSTY